MDHLEGLFVRRGRSAREPGPPGRDPVLSLGLALAIVLGIALIATHLLNSFALDESVRQFDADEEKTVFSWASASATFGAAVVSTLLALWFPGQRFRFGVLAGILAFFSVDDAVGIHELLSQASTDDLGLPVASQRLLWPVVYLPVAAIAIVVLLGAARTGRVRAYMRAGIGLLVLAIVAELASVMWNGLFFDSRTLDVVEVALEESSELAGWILVASAMAAVLHLAFSGEPESHRTRAERRPIPVSSGGELGPDRIGEPSHEDAVGPLGR